jgi:hypothetical protein
MVLISARISASMLRKVEGKRKFKSRSFPLRHRMSMWSVLSPKLSWHFPKPVIDLIIVRKDK